MIAITKRGKFWNAYKDYYPLVYSVLVSRLRNSEDAEDISQEVFIRFFKNIDKIDNYRSWLLKALNFEITNYYGRKSNKEFSKVDIEDISNDLKLSNDDKFRETRLIINEAIENVKNYKNEKEKILFDLVAVHNFSYDKAAKYLGITKWQVQYKYSRIEKRILEYLNDKGVSELDDLI